MPLEEDLQTWHSQPTEEQVLGWAVWDAAHEQVIALGDLWTLQTPENQHLAFVEMSVLPAYRRQGLGRLLLGLHARSAQEQGRRLMMMQTHSRADGGAAWMRRLGAQPGLEGQVNQLRLEELPPGLISDWLRAGGEQAGEFELAFWDTSYPEEQIEAIAEMFQLVNDEPRGDLEIEDRMVTPRQLREIEEQQQARGMQRWTCYLRDKRSGRLGGFTEVFWNPNRPDQLKQGFTGVHPDFRGHGLGRWLKAAMLERVQRERPEVRLVRTNNANSNAPMLAINLALGFKPYLATVIWQIETERVLAYTSSG